MKRKNRKYTRNKERSITEAEIIARKRADQMLSLYRQGHTLEQLGEKYKFTRSRAQQIVSRGLLREIKINLKRGELSNPDHKTVKQLARETIDAISYERRRTEILRILDEKRKEGVIPEKYYSKLEFAEALGCGIDSLEKYVPEIFEVVEQNSLIRKRMWSRYYLRCRNCGTTTIRHRSFGYCYKCYEKTDDFKEIQRASRMRNKEKWDIRTKEYLKEYYKRPEVRERLKLKRREYQSQKLDKLKFGGNREKAIEAHDYKCGECGLTREENKVKYSRDLNVIHLNGDKNDNSLSNLSTLCLSCFRKRFFRESNRIYNNSISFISKII